MIQIRGLTLFLGTEFVLDLLGWYAVFVWERYIFMSEGELFYKNLSRKMSDTGLNIILVDADTCMKPTLNPCRYEYFAYKVRYTILTTFSHFGFHRKIVHMENQQDIEKQREYNGHTICLHTLVLILHQM